MKFSNKWKKSKHVARILNKTSNGKIGFECFQSEEISAFHQGVSSAIMNWQDISSLCVFKEIIVSSFHWNIQTAIVQADFQWLMFYPCLYFFAMDTYRDAGGGKSPFSLLPFVFSAYFVPYGVIFSLTLSFSEFYGDLFGYRFYFCSRGLHQVYW